MRGKPAVRRNGGGSSASSSYLESNGPSSIKIKGNVAQIHERYTTLAKEASQSGNDREYVENLLQHAEHYFRLAREKKEKAHSRQAAKTGGADATNAPAPRRKNRFDQAPVQVEEPNRRNGDATSTHDVEDEDKQGLLDFLGVERDPS